MAAGQSFCVQVVFGLISINKNYLTWASEIWCGDGPQTSLAAGYSITHKN